MQGQGHAETREVGTKEYLGDRCKQGCVIPSEIRRSTVRDLRLWVTWGHIVCFWVGEWACFLDC